MALAEDSIDNRKPGWHRLAWLLGFALLLALLVGLGMALKSWLGAPDKAERQVARITVLPDKPPPPPPPPPPPKALPKPEPVQTNKPPAQAPPKPQPESPPAEAPIKMEGEAGDGPSPFQAGAVTNDYSGGAPVVGGAPGASAPRVVDRLQQRLYVQAVRPLLRDAIEQRLRAEAVELVAELRLWVAADGGIARLELQPGTSGGDEAALRQALDGTRRELRLPAPPLDLQPMNFRLTVRPQV